MNSGLRWAGFHFQNMTKNGNKVGTIYKVGTFQLFKLFKLCYHFCQVLKMEIIFFYIPSNPPPIAVRNSLTNQFFQKKIDDSVYLKKKMQNWREEKGHFSFLNCPNFVTIFKATALWADAFYKSKCLSVCVSVCPCVRLCVCSLLRYRLTVFLPPLPEVGCPIFLEIGNPWGKVMERSGLRYEHFCLKIV